METLECLNKDENNFEENAEGGASNKNRKPEKESISKWVNTAK